MIKKELLDILCCPETRQAVSVAEPALIEKINQKIERRELNNLEGAVVEKKLDEGLIRADRRVLYPVRDDIPIMLVNEAIPLAGIL